MGNRITNKDVESALDNLNELLKSTGREIELGHRYGHSALDLKNIGSTSVLRTLKAGLSKREAYEAIWDMINGIRLCNCKCAYEEKY